MDANGFWEIMDRVGSPEELQRELEQLPDSELADFEVEHQRAWVTAYDWGLWGAAFVIAGGCSDDSFMDFRSYLLSLGRAVYEAALADPDSLADVEDLDDGEGWEDWSSPTLVLVEARTGKFDYLAPDRHPAGPADPTGEDWDEDDLEARFPRLSAKYDGA